MSTGHDVVIVGGGPSGLALAIGAAMRGLSCIVLERSRYPVDKACGEGLMPKGVTALERLGVRDRLSPTDCSPFEGIKYIQEDGTFAEGRFKPGTPGLGIRRVALSAALVERAREVGAQVHEGTAARGWELQTNGVKVQTDSGPTMGKLLVAADGLNSALRKAQAMEGETDLPQRFGLRRHYRLSAWSPFVEVHFAPGVEAYVTPVGAQRIGVAFLFTKQGDGAHVTFESLLSRFPVLEDRLKGVEYDSTARGSGPLARSVPMPAKDRFVLLGDSAGYVDAITGEGLTLGFMAAEALAEVLPQAIAAGLTVDSLNPYVRAHRREFGPYSMVTRRVLWGARHPRLRRTAIRVLGRTPRLFDYILHRLQLRNED